MRHLLAPLLGAAALVAALAPHAAANPFCQVAGVPAAGPVCAVQCVATRLSGTCFTEN